MSTTPFGEWTDICDAAMLAPDTQRDNEFIAARLVDESGRMMSPDEIGAIRDAGWEWIRSRPSIGKGSVLPT